MATITLRMSEEDTRLIRQYAEMTGTTVSQFVRQAALDRIEDEYDRSALTRYLEMGSNRDSPERIMRISMSAAYSSKRATPANHFPRLVFRSGLPRSRKTRPRRWKASRMTGLSALER